MCVTVREKNRMNVSVSDQRNQLGVHPTGRNDSAVKTFFDGRPQRTMETLKRRIISWCLLFTLTRVVATLLDLDELRCLPGSRFIDDLEGCDVCSCCGWVVNFAPFFPFNREVLYKRSSYKFRQFEKRKRSVFTLYLPPRSEIERIHCRTRYWRSDFKTYLYTMFSYTVRMKYSPNYIRFSKHA